MATTASVVGARVAAALRPLKGPVTLVAALLFLVLTVIVIRWLQPVKPPRLTLITSAYSSRSQSASALGSTDKLLLASLDDAFGVTQAAPRSLSYEALRNLTQRLVDLPPQRRWFFWPRTTELVYVNAPGIALPDEAGDRLVPYLLPDDFQTALNVERFPRGQALPVADLLEALAQSPSDHKILVLDCQRFEQFWPLGIVSNSFVEAVQEELLQQPDRYRGVSVLSSCSEGEVTYGRSGEQRSAFGYYFVRGIRGDADSQGGNSDGRVTLWELVEYLQVNVAGWVQNQRADRQHPLMLTGVGEPQHVVLAVAEKNVGASLESELTAGGSPAAAGKAPTTADAPSDESPADAPVADALSELGTAWRQYYTLARGNPPPREDAPYLWRELEQTLLHAEALYRDGDLTGMNEQLGKVPFRVADLSANRASPAQGKPAFSFPMLDLFDGPPQPAPKQPQEGNPADKTGPNQPQQASTPAQPAEAPANQQDSASPDSAAKPATTAKPAATAKKTPNAANPDRPTQPLSRAEVVDLINQVRDGSQTALAVGKQLNSAPPGKYPMPAEAALVSMMAENWPKVSANDQPRLDARARQLVRQRYDAEQAAAPAQSHAPQVFRWIQPLVDTADQHQRRAEDAFFEDPTGPLENADGDAAAKLYALATGDGQIVAKAVALREQLLAELPYLTRLAVSRPVDTDDRFREFVAQKTRELLIGARTLGEQLGAYPSRWDPRMQAASIAGIESTRASLATAHAELKRRLADELVRLAPAGDPQPLTTAVAWRRADALLLLPFACSDEPAETLSQRRIQLLRRLQMPLATADNKATATQPDANPADNLPQYARAARDRQVRDLVLQYFALAGAPQPTDLADQLADTGQSRAVAASWLWTYQTAVNTPTDGDPADAQAASSTACRLLDPRLVAAAFPAFETAPTQVLRRSHLSDLVGWHALRRGEDFWAIRRNSAESYGMTTAHAYLAVAGELSSQPTLQQAATLGRLNELKEMSQKFEDAAASGLLTADPPSVLFRGTDTQAVRLTLNKANLPAGEFRLRLEPGPVADPKQAILAVRPVTADHESPTQDFEVSRQTLRGFASSLSARLFFRGHISIVPLPVTAVAEEGNLNLVYQRQPPGDAKLVVQLDEIVRNPTNVLFVLDLSRSMGQLPGNRIDALRKKLQQFAVEASGSGLVVGIRVFGHRYVWQRGDAASEQAARTDTQLLLPMQPFPRNDFQAVVSQLKPVGESPLFQALLDAAKDFEGIAEGENVIVVISDGSDNWARVGQGPGLDDLRAAYRNSGIVINAIGFQTDAFGFAQLQNITSLRGGKAVRASNADELRASIYGLSRVLRYVVQRQVEAAPPQQVHADILRYPGPRLSLAPGSYDVRIVDQDNNPVAPTVNVQLLPDQLQELLFRGGQLAYPPIDLTQDVATSDPSKPTIVRVLRADRVDEALELELAVLNRQDPAWTPRDLRLKIRPRGSLDVAMAPQLPSNVPGHYFPVWNFRIENWPEEIDHAEIEADWAKADAAPSDRPCFVLDAKTGSFTPPLPTGFALTRRKLGALPAGESRGAAKELLTLTLVAPEGYSHIQDWGFHFLTPPSFARERYNAPAGVYTGQFAFFDGQPPSTILLLGPPTSDDAAKSSRISAKVSLRLRKINAAPPSPKAAPK